MTLVSDKTYCFGALDEAHEIPILGTETSCNNECDKEDEERELNVHFNARGHICAVDIHVQEHLDPSFHCYVWPSALMLAEYVWAHRDSCRGLSVIELGAGAGLPGLLAAQLGARVMLTDRPVAIPQLQHHIATNLSTRSLGSAQAMSLCWGQFALQGGVQRVLDHFTQLDWILGADVLYAPEDFEALMATVAFLLQRYPTARFLTVYQERSAARTLQPLLDRWQLSGHRIDPSTFSWDVAALQSAAGEMEGVDMGALHSLSLYEFTRCH